MHQADVLTQRARARGLRSQRWPPAPAGSDQAVLVPLPDADCRRRLFEVYGRGLRLQLDDPDTAIARTEGVSAAFIKELLRRAALVVVDADGGAADGRLTVADHHLSEALREMLVEGTRCPAGCSARPTPPSRRPSRIAPTTL